METIAENHSTLYNYLVDYGLVLPLGPVHAPQEHGQRSRPVLALSQSRTVRLNCLGR